MFEVGAVLTATFDIRLIILSVAIAIVGSCIALDISEQVFVASGRACVWWLLGGAITLGISIWVMHFTAILSYKLPIKVDYNYTIVMISMVEEGEKLFQVFQQVGSNYRKRQGTGLGLVVSRNLARLHGGDIILKSEVGRGSCFTLLLPL